MNSPKCIQAVNRDVVHKICSGQVVLTLATAVKELVENSLDAGSKSIEIRLKNYGSECVEVIDDGYGVKEDDFEALTLKHHTSKVEKFEDVVLVNTFGFRGEALSSLCSLSNVTVTTRHQDAGVATKLEFDHEGVLVKQTPCARQIGTTVTLLNLFSSLPVRHKEFIRNLKKEFSKMIHILSAYCLISSGIQITCSNQVEKGRRNNVIATHTNNSLRANIADIFGSKQLNSLLQFRQINPDCSVAEEYGLSNEVSLPDLYNIEGFVSSVEHGEGRSSCDRQFVFINGRPCDLSKVSKVVNETYHQFNRNQYPVIILNIKLNQEAVDINVTPDKRKILVAEEKVLLAVLKSSLLQMYDKTGIECSSRLSKATEMEWNHSKEKTNVEDETEKEPINSSGLSCSASAKRSKGKVRLEIFKRSISHLVGKELTAAEPISKQPRLDKFFNRSASLVTKSEIEDLVNEKLVTSNDEASHTGQEREEFLGENGTTTISEIPRSLEILRKTEEKKVSTFKYEIVSASKTDVNGTNSDEEESHGETMSCHTEKTVEVECFEDDDVRPIRKVVEVSYNIKRTKTSPIASDFCQPLGFRAKISPEDNEAAETELNKKIGKTDFRKMEIIGQFNLGFVIVRLGSHLFVVDQHATDEKFNYERLKRDTILEGQKLLRPCPLELTAASEIVLMDNLEIFRKNGFDFMIDENERCTQRIKLTSVPVSKTIMFGKDDIEELIFMLSDSSGIMCRPSKVQRMLASRACRSSVMIGTHLKRSQMRTLVDHMGEMEQPWNCPHGRPTMRHLIDLNMVSQSDGQRQTLQR